MVAYNFYSRFYYRDLERIFLKKFTVILFSLILLFSLFESQYAFAEKQFSDVTINHWANREIDYLSSKEIINGFPDGTFQPEQSITRLQALIMILKEKEITDFTKVENPEFIDVHEDDFCYEIIAKSVELGIIKGSVNEDGEKVFNPSNPLTRAQMASILTNAYPLQGTMDIRFLDVPTNYWAYNSIQLLSANKITAGFPDGTFGVNNDLTRAQFSVMMARLLDESFREGVTIVYPPPKVEVPITDRLLPDVNSRERVTPITHVVLHFVSNASASPKSPYNLEAIRQLFINYGVSSHYIIDRNGNIIRFVPEDRVAYHAGKGNLNEYPHYKDRLNDYSIGIELMAIGTQSEMKSMVPNEKYRLIQKEHIGYTEAQYKSLQLLLDDIVERNPLIKYDRTHIIGHDEYAPTRKTDPGSLFQWGKIIK